ncbi:exodeoxyribonuclease III [Hippea jasoniae]|uniref:exodeoxyribonuclease III n=1 Tax=Hippea jasoniae TaxID=944479 RepID=UPI0005535DFF|nr:exodeoxyribonuclease III [Hippea jasoniae]
MELTIATWNVNSIRARLNQVLNFIDENNIDILCIQETKVEDNLFPKEEFENLGYEVAVYGQKRFNGVATISKFGFEAVEPYPDQKNHKRLLISKIKGITIFNAYFPNGQSPDSEHFIYKLNFINNLKKYLEDNYKTEDNIIILGDFNVAMDDIDVYDPVAMEGKIGFHIKEREVLKNLYQWGFIDTFRKFNKEKAFSWWDYRAGNFWKNIGLRIDYIWATKPLADKCINCYIDKRERKRKKPSDHAPVVAVFRLEG